MVSDKKVFKHLMWETDMDIQSVT